ncbi:MAG: hybrid sensor histidine kinase/response regulator [Leptospiraceae bacterium]|nr:hybrid sensor histidine kinase/response regulator [Leptospiraceae bacterium]MCP5497083.1 hybrid sensor histidine kinase/response regulator [Leptospiraceae bacterium]
MENNEINKSTILIVDDNPTNLQLLYKYFLDLGFKILLSYDGDNALEIVKNELPDIILLDIIMPNKNGYEVCQILKSQTGTKDIPIIFISALNETVDKVKGFQLGGVDYITKPFQQEEVLARISAHLTITKQKKQLKELNASKDKFFSIIAHDLKNPFNGLIGMSNFLLSRYHDLNDERRIMYLQEIENLSKNSYELLDNLLQWARTQTNRIQLIPKEYDLSMVVNTNINLIQEIASKKNVIIESQIDTNTLVFTDINVLNTIIRNLLTNAVKFSYSGGVVKLYSIGHEDYKDIVISDTGIGMEQEVIQKLFRIDDHVSTLGTANESGSGLGLILCNEFIKKSNGKIWVESAPGQGSKFFVRLPIKSF